MCCILGTRDTIRSKQIMFVACCNKKHTVADICKKIKLSKIVEYNKIESKIELKNCLIHSIAIDWYNCKKKMFVGTILDRTVD